MNTTISRTLTTKVLLAASVAAALIQCTTRGQNAPPAPPAPPAAKTAETNAVFPDKKEKLSYAVGENMGSWLRKNDYDLDMDVFVAALKDSMAAKPMKLTDAEAMKEMQGHSQELMAKRQEEQRKLAEKNREEGEKWLAANKEKPGVKNLTVPLPGPGGKTAELQYKVVTEGTGPVPKTNDQVVVNYRASTIDGKEFDSSTKHQGNVKLNLAVPPPRFGSYTPPGVYAAVKQMPVGSKWEVYLPSNLGFGDGRGPVEPGSTLIYELELASIEAPPQPLTSDIIKVPSAEELKNGAKVEVLKPEDVARLTQGTNGAAPKK
jgi:FKBP-type peptidyl-prolyl cis-trans isomerase